MARNLKAALAASTVVPAAPANGLSEEHNAVALAWRNFFKNNQGRDTTLSNKQVYDIACSIPDQGNNPGEVVDAILSQENPNMPTSEDKTIDATIQSVAMTNRSAAAMALIASNNKTFEGHMIKLWDSEEFVRRGGAVLCADMFGVIDEDGDVVVYGIYSVDQRKQFAIPGSTFISKGHPQYSKHATHCLVKDEHGKYTVVVPGISDEYPTIRKNAQGKDSPSKGSWYTDFGLTLPWIKAANAEYEYFAHIADGKNRAEARPEHIDWSQTRIETERNRMKQRRNRGIVAIKQLVTVANKMAAINAMDKVGCVFFGDVEGEGDDATFNMALSDPILIFDKTQKRGADNRVSITTLLAYDIKDAMKNGGTYKALIESAKRETKSTTTQPPTVNKENWTGNASENATFIRDKTNQAFITARIAAGTITDDEVLLIGWQATGWTAVFAGMLEDRFYKLIQERAEAERKEAAAKLAAAHNEKAAIIAKGDAAEKAGVNM